MKHCILFLLLVCVFALSSQANAQTIKTLPPTPSAAQPAQAMRPIADSVVQQAEDQANGKFGSMNRAGVGGQIQDAWDDTDNEIGVFLYPVCSICTYKVRTREHMVTVIELPDGEVIERADIGDSGSFDVKTRGTRRLAVKPLGFGVDSNLIIYGASGAVYPIYLRAESFNSVNVPDLIVRITGRVTITDIAIDGIEGLPSASPKTALPPLQTGVLSDAQKAAVEGMKTPEPERKADDFVQEAPFDINSLRGWGQYKLWAGGPDGALLEPETVFRDDHFTYIRFGNRWKDLELPTAYVVVDDIDELVNTRVQGQTFIIESTRALITLKSGLSYICIQYEGKA